MRSRTSSVWYMWHWGVALQVMANLRCFNRILKPLDKNNGHLHLGSMKWFRDVQHAAARGPLSMSLRVLRTFRSFFGPRIGTKGRVEEGGFGFGLPVENYCRPGNSSRARELEECDENTRYYHLQAYHSGENLYAYDRAQGTNVLWSDDKCRWVVWVQLWHPMQELSS